MTASAKRRMPLAHLAVRPPPLYVKVADQLRREILAQRKPGDKLESGPDLAKRLGVSVLTVREAVNALTQEGLLERARGSGTYVRDPGMRPVAILVGLDPSDLRRSYFFLQLVHRLEAILHGRKIPCRQYFGYVARNAAGQPVLNPMFLEDVRQDQVGLVVPISLTIDSGLQQNLDRQRVAVVGDGAIMTDYEGMVRAGAGYLLAHGRRRLALAQSPDEATSRCFAALLHQAGVDAERAWMRSVSDWHDADAVHALFSEIWNARPDRPDGILCLNDYLFERMIPAILELGVAVPRDLMVVTHANKGADIRYPFPVARMEIDPDAYAEILADRVADHLAGRPAAPPVVMTHRWLPEQPV